MKAKQFKLEVTITPSKFSLEAFCSEEEAERFLATIDKYHFESLMEMHLIERLMLMFYKRAFKSKLSIGENK